MINKKELEEIIEKLMEVCREKELFVLQGVDYKTIFQEACSYHRGLLAQKSKQNYKTFTNNKKELMTEKQEAFIKKNEKILREKGFDIDNIQSKSDAFKIISEFKKLK